MRRPAPKQPGKPEVPPTDQQPGNLQEIRVGMLHMQAELLVHRMYVTQLVCVAAGLGDDPEGYVNGLKDQFTDNIIQMPLPGLKDDVARLFRQKMQEFNRALHQSALASVTHPDNPAAKAGKIRR